MLNISSPDILNAKTRRRVSNWLVDCRKAVPDARNLSLIYIGLKLCDVVLAIAFASCLASLVLYLIGRADDVLPVEPTKLFLISILICCGRAAILWSLEGLSTRSANLISDQLRRSALKNTLKSGCDQAGTATYELFEGIEAIRGYFVRYRPAVLSLAIGPPVMCVALILIDSFSGLVLLFCGILVPCLNALSGWRTARLSMIEFDRLSQMSAYFLDRVSGLLVLRTLGQISAETRRIAEMSENLRHAARRVLRVAFLPALTTDLILMGGLVIIAAHSVNILAVETLIPEFQARSRATFTDQHHALLVLFLLPEFFLPFRRLSAHYHDRMRAFAAAQSLSQLIVTPKSSTTWDWQRDVPYFCTPPKLELRHIDCPNLDLSKPVSLAVPAGSILALAGPSGVGKSTVLNVVAGFQQNVSGKILCNDEAMSFESLASDSWRQSIAWMGQESHLFYGTVADNLLLAGLQNEHDLDHQKDILTDLGLGHLQPDSPVGQGGQLLSGGQRRRLLLGRALLQHAPLVCLDEPTAHLDAQAEQLCIDALTKRKGSATLIIATHSPAILKIADQVYRLNRSDETGASS